MLLKVAFTLLIFAFLEKGVRGQCSTPPINLAVYEGTLDTFMTCNRQSSVTWQIVSTGDELGPAVFTNPDDTVKPEYANLYGANQTGVLIKNATTTPGTELISTSGIYIVKNSTNARMGAKLLVVREGPTCSCNAINSTTLQIDCSIKYADGSLHPIKANMNWTSGDNFYKSETPQRSRVDTYWFVQKSTITADASVPANYQCTVTFEKPTDIQYPWIATNAPTFTASCTAPCVQCLPQLKNIAVYEGETDILMDLATDPGTALWSVKTIVDELGTYGINSMDGGVEPSLAGLYNVTQAGLVIKNATTTADDGNPIASAGLYIAQCANNTNKTGAKLVVVRGGPVCLCNESTSTLSCGIVYGDSSYQPINARMTWKLDGVVVKSEVPERIRDEPVFVETSTITDDSGVPATYDCEVTFDAPTNIQFPFIASNAPEFNASCSIAVCGLTTTSPASTTTTWQTTTLLSTIISFDRCIDNLQNVRNVAVYEGQLNTLMDLSADDPQSVRWRVKPASDELALDPTANYPGLYDQNQSGLIIKNATTMPDNVNSISTAGMYIAECANYTNKTGAKLLVVRSGPDCSCNETNNQLSCSIIYADGTIQPIYPIVRWIVNGMVYLTQTLTRTRIDPYVFQSTSTISVTDPVPGDYTCELTFDKPTNIQYQYFATNAPEFNASCSTSVCWITTTSSTTATTLLLTTTTQPPTPTTITTSIELSTTSPPVQSTLPTATMPTTMATTTIAPCSGQLKNIAVYEGNTSIHMDFPADPNDVRWIVVSTKDELTDEAINPNGGSTVDPSLANDFSIDSSGLTILNATTTAEDPHRISTAGLYKVECGGKTFECKLLVVKEPSVCWCSKGSTVILSCSVKYADSSYNAIAAVMNWYRDGVLSKTETPTRTNDDAYTYISTSTLTIPDGDTATYTCVQTFGEPTEVQSSNTATNAPEFSQNCTTMGC